MASKRRAREDPCHICGHYHNYEGGEPCSICGHVMAPCIEKKQADTVIPATIIPGFLYLGSYDTASRAGVLKTMNITHILNCVPSCQVLFRNTFSYHTVTTTPPQYEECINFIEETRKKPDSKILVHCMSGTSRSPGVVIAYLMKSRNWRLAPSYRWVKDKRPAVSIHPDEAQRLMDLEVQLFGSCSAPGGLAALDTADLAFTAHPLGPVAELQAAAPPIADLSSPPAFPSPGGQVQWSLSPNAMGGIVFGSSPANNATAPAGPAFGATELASQNGQPQQQQQPLGEMEM